MRHKFFLNWKMEVLFIQFIHDLFILCCETSKKNGPRKNELLTKTSAKLILSIFEELDCVSSMGCSNRPSRTLVKRRFAIFSETFWSVLKNWIFFKTFTEFLAETQKLHAKINMYDPEKSNLIGTSRNKVLDRPWGLCRTSPTVALSTRLCEFLEESSRFCFVHQLRHNQL